MEAQQVRLALAYKGIAHECVAVAHIMLRLYAPVLPAFQDIAGSEQSLLAYKADVGRRFGMRVEAFSNDRYDGFQQLVEMSRLPELARHLGKNKFY